MNKISGFWHGAACLSGRVDFSVAIAANGHRIAELSAHQLTQAGICSRHQKRLRNTPCLMTRHNTLCLDDSSFPDSLRYLPFAPPVLFYMGNVHLLHEPRIAMVGARQCTQRGREITRTIAGELAHNGLVVVSGMAHGIDTAAHGACDGRTVAVLGEGLDRATKGRKAKQIKSIVEAGGLVVSEFPPSMPASRHTFPQRNRVIAGLSSATIVVEATMRSGSRITARHALNAGRDVMAVPGHPFDASSTGCNALIQEGAALVQNAEDILHVLGIEPTPLVLHLPTSPIEQTVLAALETAATFDELVAQTALSIPQLLQSIEALELTGWVQRLPGDRLRRRNTP